MTNEMKKNVRELFARNFKSYLTAQDDEAKRIAEVDTSTIFKMAVDLKILTRDEILEIKKAVEKEA